MQSIFTKTLLFFGTLLWVSSLSAQVVTKGVIILNGGSFSNPTDNPTVSFYTPQTDTYETLDSIGSSSVQDLLIEGTRLYVAAADSIVLYDMPTGARLAAVAFGAPSTITMRLYNEYLLVGNWFASSDNNFRIFDRETLDFVDNVPEIFRGAKDFVVVGDTAYITQNYQTSSFTDSAGWMVKVDLATLTYADSVAVNAHNEDFGRLFVQDSVIYGLNGVSNSITAYDLRTGMVSTDTANANLQPSTYNSRIAQDENGLVYTLIDGKIATYDPANRAVIEANIVDTVVTSFAIDTLADRIYLTQTNFSGLKGGIIYDLEGNRIDTLLVGTSPEEVGVVYNVLPQATNDTFITTEEFLINFDPLGNDTDLDANRDSLKIAVITPAAEGTTMNFITSISYTPRSNYFGVDSIQYAIVDEWGDADTAMAYIEVRRTSNIETAGIQMVLFPNPTSERLNLQLSASVEGVVSLLDLQGRTLSTQEVAQGQKTFSWNVSALPAGMYLVQIQHDKGTQTLRWVRQ